MKGIICAGGLGTRLYPLTKITNKHLLPIYDRPMIYYPLQKLVDAGIKEIMIVSGPEYAGDFLRLLGSGKDFKTPKGEKIKIVYEVQDEPLGIANAIYMAKDFVGKDNCTIFLGDNLFENDFTETIQNFTTGAHVFLKEVHDPARFGVAEIDGEKVISIIEKPQNPKTNLAVTGCYIYDNRVFSIIETLKPSARGQYEITDVNNAYINLNELKATKIEGIWTDAGTFDSLYAANSWAITRSKKVNNQPLILDKTLNAFIEKTNIENIRKPQEIFQNQGNTVETEKIAKGRA